MGSAGVDRESRAETPEGELTFESTIYGAIAYRAVRLVRGVKDTHSDLMGGLIGRLSRGGAPRGIRCRDTKDGLRFEVAVIARQGSSAMVTGRAVQEAVAAAILKMTGRTDTVVNVSVKGIE